MSEVEKLYELAGIEKDWRSLPYGGIEEYYPPFTVEKQIAILMFILNKFGDIGFQKMYSIRGNDENTRKDFIKCLCDCEHETLDSRPVDFYYQNGASGNNFEESLAGLINYLWQDLTETEREEIRKILKG